MALGKKLVEQKTDYNIHKIILYVLVGAFIASFVSSVVISIILVTSKRDLSIRFAGKKYSTEDPVLGQFGSISTVILLIGIPLLILITTIAYDFYISSDGVENQLTTF